MTTLKMNAQAMLSGALESYAAYDSIFFDLEQKRVELRKRGMVVAFLELPKGMQGTDTICITGLTGFAPFTLSAE